MFSQVGSDPLTFNDLRPKFVNNNPGLDWLPLLHFTARRIGRHLQECAML